MTFDWFTFVAQIINFLILLFLLRRFLYGPITKIMTERQAGIVAQIEDAKKREADAEAALQSYHEQQSQLDEEREKLLLQARHDADLSKQALTKEARAEVDSQRTQWQQVVEKEKEAFMKALEKRISKELYQSMRQALTELADAELEQQVLKVFIRQLEHLDQSEQEAMQQALARADNEVQLVTSFPLSKENQAELHEALQGLLKQTFSLQLEQRADLICGLELNIYDQNLSWSLAAYLDSLETSVANKLSNEKVIKQEVVEA